MTRRAYQCQDCDREFEREDDTEPQCPSCESRSVTFEGYVEPSLLRRSWMCVEPAVNYVVRPWRFFEDRSIPRSTAMVLIGVFLLGVCMMYSAAPTSGTAVTAGNLGDITFLRDTVDLLNAVTSTLESNPPTTEFTLGQWGVIFGLGLLIEVYWIGVFIVIMGTGQSPGLRGRIAVVGAGSVWIPNLVAVSLQVVWLWTVGEGSTTVPYLETIHLWGSAWLAFVLLGGLWSLPLSLVQYGWRLVVSLVLQVGGIFLLLIGARQLVFPRMNLAGPVDVSLLMAADYITWPLSSLPIFS